MKLKALLKSWTDRAVVGRSRVRTANRPHPYSNRLMSLTQIAGLSCRKGGRGCLKKKQSNVLRKTPAREISQHTGRRICTGGDAPRAGGEAWGGVCKTGYCDRAFKGSARRSKAATSKRRENIGEAAKQANRDYRKGQSDSSREPSATRSHATTGALKKKDRAAASHRALSRQARAAAQKRGSTARHRSAVKANRTRARGR